MTVHPGSVFFDANTLQNFAVVGRLDLLETHYGHRAAWTESVADEVRRGVPAEPLLQHVLDAEWLGQPIEIIGDTQTLVAVDRIRRALGGPNDLPRKHLGEAETIYYIENHAPGSMLITDDRPALDFALRRQLFAINSPHVLSECYSYGEVGCPDAYELLVEMRNKGRGVLVPESHHDVC